jgi:hypothetical protein
MARRRRSSLGLSAEQAQQALSVLVHDGKLAAGEVQKALKRHRHLVSDLRAKLAALEQGAGRMVWGQDGLGSVLICCATVPGGTQRSRHRLPEYSKSAPTPLHPLSQGEYPVRS